MSGERIAGLPGFRRLAPADRDLVAGATREVHAKRGQVLFGEGEPSTAIWAVKEGVVHIMKSGPVGREIVLEVIPPGEFFGAVVALEERPYPATAVAAEDCVVWVLPSSVARDLCRKHPTLRSAILEQVTSRLRGAHERMRSMALERVEQRLARMILVLADKIGQTHDGQSNLSITRQELADMIGSTVETTIRITSKWQADGLIVSGRQTIAITAPDALRRIAAGSGAVKSD